MKLENQVVSLDLAKKLKELGVKQESYFCWLEGKDVGETATVMPGEPADYQKVSKIAVSAFTVAELGEMLPEEVKFLNEERRSQLEIQKYGKCWRVYYTNELTECNVEFNADTEADARAKMLVYLLEKELISIEQLSATSQREK